MTESLHPALLPAGMRDLLPPDAEIEAAIEARLMAGLAAYGYERVKPPLVEYEDSLLSGAGVAMAPETFRLMDPISQRMVGLRADMTLQIARIATARLVHSPRPLRLSYAGPVLRVSGDQLRPEREFGQVGAELIGSDDPQADAEVVGLAVEILESVGVKGLTVDLTVPALVPTILAALDFPADQRPLVRAALDRKDATVIAGLGGAAASILGRLMAAAGRAERGLDQIALLALPEAAAEAIRRLAAVVALIREARPGIALTIDPVENRGFEYHTGISFTIFARGMRGELGRGGRYLAGSSTGATGGRIDGSGREPSTGFTVYTDRVIRAVPAPKAPPRLYLPMGTPRELGARWRQNGFATVAGLAQAGDREGGEAAAARAEARRLACAFWLDGEEIREV